MSPLRRLWNVVRRARMDDDLRLELDMHLALIEEKERARGSSAEEARRRAGPNIAVMSYVVRSATSPRGLLPSVRGAIDTIDAKLPWRRCARCRTRSTGPRRKWRS